MGRQVSKEAESQLSIIRNGDIASYIDSLGRQLASRAPGEKYPYQFKVVNDKAINAFALPGGFVYVNRGAIEAADNEAQIAGVMAHEIGHVVLRHGTNQASKAYVAQAPLSILGGVLGSNSIGSVLAQLGIGFAANSLFLKYSRDAESQADLMGTQILYDSGYNPNAMVEFFEKIQAESKGSASQFFTALFPQAPAAPQSPAGQFVPAGRVPHYQESVGSLGVLKNRRSGRTRYADGKVRGGLALGARAH